MNNDDLIRNELKVQGLTNQVNEQNNIIMDLRVNLTILNNDLAEANKKVEELEGALTEMKEDDVSKEKGS